MKIDSFLMETFREGETVECDARRLQQVLQELRQLKIENKQLKEKVRFWQSIANAQESTIKVEL